MTMRKAKRTYAKTTGELTSILFFTASNSQKQETNWCKRISIPLRYRQKWDHKAIRQKCFHQRVQLSGKFLRNTKTLLSHGSTIQRHLIHVNTRSKVDCSCENSQTGKKLQWWPCDETSRNFWQTWQAGMFIKSNQIHCTSHHGFSGWKLLQKVRRLNTAPLRMSLWKWPTRNVTPTSAF